MLFDSIINSRWFLNSSVILFLNKTDIYRVKIKTRLLSDYFPNYQGANDFASSSAFIQEQFLALNQNTQKRTYCHFSSSRSLLFPPPLFHDGADDGGRSAASALDTEQMRFVLAAINDSIVVSTQPVSLSTQCAR